MPARRVSVASLAHAQHDTTSASARREPGAWAAAAGVGLFAMNLGTDRPGIRADLFGSVARHWSLPVRGPGVRAQLIGGASLPQALTLNELNGCAGCEVWTSRQFAGANVALTHEWRVGRSVRPYVPGGGGLYYSRATHDHPRTSFSPITLGVRF